METLSPTPPLPTTDGEAERRKRAGLRLRLMRGQWFDDLREHMGQHFDEVRERIVGRPDLSTNVLLSVVKQLAVLYDRPPILHHESEAAIEAAQALLGPAGWWPLGTKLQRMTIACQESFTHASLTADGRVLLRVVTPDLVWAEASPEEPDLPIRFQEARVRVVDGNPGWYLDDYDLTDPAAPSYRVIRAKDKEDVTAAVLPPGTWRGNYPANLYLSDGRPILPYATYHAERTGDLWNGSVGVEAVDGTLTVAVLWSWWVHCVRDAAWAQRWTVDAVARGAGSTGSGANTASTITTDPSSVMQFRGDGDRAAVGQWNPAIDPLTLGTALAEFEARLLVHFGLAPGDAQRSDASASSGYALTIRRDAVRAAQRRYAPQFARGDSHLLAVVSALTGGAIPPDGWTVTYPGPPKSWDETQADLDRGERMINAGLASPVDVYMEQNPGVTREQALARLRDIAAERRALG